MSTFYGFDQQSANRIVNVTRAAERAGVDTTAKLRRRSPAPGRSFWAMITAPVSTGLNPLFPFSKGYLSSADPSMPLIFTAFDSGDPQYLTGGAACMSPIDGLLPGGTGDTWPYTGPVQMFYEFDQQDPPQPQYFFFLPNVGEEQTFLITAANEGTPYSYTATRIYDTGTASTETTWSLTNTFDTGGAHGYGPSLNIGEYVTARVISWSAFVAIVSIPQLMIAPGTGGDGVKAVRQINLSPSIGVTADAFTGTADLTLTPGGATPFQTITVSAVTQFVFDACGLFVTAI